MNRQKTALLVASFGTAHAESRAKTVAPLEEKIQSAFPERKFYRCYTSPTVRRLMERREGILTDGPVEAMERIAADGVEDLLVFVTHVIPGIESERIARQVREFQDAHPQIRVRLTKPLLWEDEDYEACAEILLDEYGEFLRSGETETGKNAMILFGHGTRHAGDACYERLEQVMRRKWRENNSNDGDGRMVWAERDNDSVCGRPLAEQKKCCGYIYVITVEGSRRAEDILPELEADGAKKALILPFLLTAGEHVMHDMAGDEPGSAVNIFRGAGIEAIPMKKGLGEYDRIREYYVRRCRRDTQEKSGSIKFGMGHIL